MKTQTGIESMSFVVRTILENCISGATLLIVLTEQLVAANTQIRGK